MLTIENLNAGYAKRQVLYNISFEINKGDIALLIGSNGSGKSTLLKSIFNLCQIIEGKVNFENQIINGLSANQLIKKGILFLPQKNNVFEHLTVKENIETSGITFESKKMYETRFNTVMQLFPHLNNFLNLFPSKMSGGQRQQLALAMTMLHSPKLLLLDEPFTGLTPIGIEEIRNKIKEINRVAQTTIILVEHRIKEALPIANQILGLKMGELVYNSSEITNFTNDKIKAILI